MADERAFGGERPSIKVLPALKIRKLLAVIFENLADTVKLWRKNITPTMQCFQRWNVSSTLDQW